jgi:hypothetical protein
MTDSIWLATREKWKFEKLFEIGLKKPNLRQKDETESWASQAFKKPEKLN